MILSLTPGTAAHEFACHSSACRPPTSGGTGGSVPSGVRHGGVASQVRSGSSAAYAKRAVKAGHGMGNAEGTMGTVKYVRSDGTPVSKNYPGAKPFDEWKKERQAAERAKLDRMMGIKPERTVRVKGAGKWSDWQGN